MFPFFSLFGQILPTYGVVIFLGISLGILLAVKRASIYGWPGEEVFYAALYGGIGLLVGGKLLYIFLTFSYLQETGQLQALLKGGFVFYGGLLGFVLGVAGYCKQFHREFCPLMEIFALPLPFAHGIGRLACLCAGCCYGIPVPPPWGILPYATASQKVFPVQLAEAASLFILFFFFSLQYRKRKTNGQIFGNYLLGYAFIRFFLEFLRGDPQRGFFLWFSLSQWISLFLIPTGFFLRRRAAQFKIRQKTGREVL